MKRRIINLLLSISLSVSTILGACQVVAYSDLDTKAISEYEEEANGEDNVSTGTQERYKENEVDADADIQGELDSLVSEEWEEIDIKDAKDLLKLSKDCRLDTWSRNKVINLKNDINLTDSEFKTIPTFGGIFNGNGYTISGMTLYEENSHIGLFSELQKNAVVIDLKVSGYVIPKGEQSVVGGIAGRNYGVIMNCSYKGTVSSKDYVGGIAGINELSGIISDCVNDGYILGEHFTGGIAGENMGSILRCTNSGEVNTKDQDVSMSLEDLSITKLKSMFTTETDQTESDSAAMANGIVDMGGIAGLNVGVIQYGKNTGTVGYEKIGYNVGGIAGRQSGYIGSCTNEGHILGRKDVGGIVGQAEPYVTIDYTQDIIYQLSDNIGKLHDLIAFTLDDVDGQSDTITNRLNIIKQFTDSALTDTDYLANATIDWVDGVAGTANEAISRVEYIMDETVKENGPIDQTKNAVGHLKSASEHLLDTLIDLNIYDYLTPEEQKQFEEYSNSMIDSDKEYASWFNEATPVYTQYYLDKIRNSSSWDSYDGTPVDYTADPNNESDLRPTENGTLNEGWTYTAYSNELTRYMSIYEKYKNVEPGGWKHTPSYESFPVTDSSSPYYAKDTRLTKDVAASSNEIAKLAEKYANEKYHEKYGSSATPKSDSLDYGTKMAKIIYGHLDEMDEATRNDAKKAVDELKEAADNVDEGLNSTKNMVQNLKDRGEIRVPTLGAEYKEHASSLNNSLQGMSDNFGFLNNELNGTSKVMTDDLRAVNDQFNVIMQLFTDAVDGVLDADYSVDIEDNSLEVAATCMDATIADCVNRGLVEGSLDVSGIAGTMAIEYDYDLESDVTGIKDSKMNTTYLTKCVIRKDINDGLVKAEKSYVAGVCGLQEMGTILGCENYAKITSNSGKYIGGIAGSSISDIISCYSKCILSGSEYVGGIAGMINNAADCYSIVNIEDGKSLVGAIAGDVNSEGRVRNNYFVSEDLAGIDRVSYSMKAEPMEYADMIECENIPNRFRLMTITFLLDDEDSDEERIELGGANIHYGSELKATDYPAVPTKEGYYAVFDTDPGKLIYEDEEITASYVRNVTTLASAATLSNHQSAVLVDGQFKESDVLEAELNPTAVDMLNGAIEYWELTIPDDWATEHKIRYLVGDEYRDKIGSDFSIYLRKDGEWTKIEDVTTMGGYYTFTAPGNVVKFQVVNEHKGIEAYLCYIVVGAIILLALVIVIIVVLALRSKKSKESKKDIKKAKK